jgi:hypothetical protein
MPRHAQEHWPAYEAKMRARGLSDAAVGAFKRNFDQLVAGVTGMVGVWLLGGGEKPAARVAAEKERGVARAVRASVCKSSAVQRQP